MMVPSFAASAEATGSADQKVNDSIVADWKFSKENVKSGTLENGNMIIEDASQNGNDLELVTVGDSSSPELEKIMKWSEDDYDQSRKC